MTVTAFITAYSPIVVTVLGYISTFCILWKKVKHFSFRDDTLCLEKKVDEMIAENKKLREDNRQLRKQLSLIIDKNMHIANYEEVHENEITEKDN